MCQGNKLEKVRADYPKQFVDTGICESHAVAYAAGMAKAGAKPIVNIYSTFLQRAFDNIFRRSRYRTCRSSSRSTAPASPGRTGRRTTACSTCPTCGSSRT